MAAGEGMPIYRNPFEKGNLIVQFEVEYPSPEWFCAEANRTALEKLLPPKTEQGTFESFYFSVSKIQCLISFLFIQALESNSFLPIFNTALTTLIGH